MGIDELSAFHHHLYGSYDLKEVKEELQILKDDGYKGLTINQRLESH